MSDDRLTWEELIQPMPEGRTLNRQFAEIRVRVVDLAERFAEEKRHSDGIQTNVRSLEPLIADTVALVGYLELLLGENQRLVACLVGLAEAGTISRAELEVGMGTRDV